VKKIMALAIVAAALSLGACWLGPDGDVYLSFDWTYTPEYFVTDDPSLPDTIWRGAEYATSEGDWYFEYYHAESGYRRWIHYSLEAHDGFFGIQGDDAVFELFLSAFENPAFIQWQSETGEPAAQPDSVQAATTTARTPERLVPSFERTMESGGWTLELKGGVIEPAGR